MPYLDFPDQQADFDGGVSTDDSVDVQAVLFGLGPNASGPGDDTVLDAMPGSLGEG